MLPSPEAQESHGATSRKRWCFCFQSHSFRRWSKDIYKEGVQEMGGGTRGTPSTSLLTTRATCWSTQVMDKGDSWFSACLCCGSERMRSFFISCCFIWASFQQRNMQIHIPATGKFVPGKASKQEYNSDILFIIVPLDWDSMLKSCYLLSQQSYYTIYVGSTKRKMNNQG